MKIICLELFGICKTRNSKEGCTADNIGFCASWADGITMSSSAYPSCGSGRSFSIGHLNIFFYICFSIGSGSGQKEY